MVTFTWTYWCFSWSWHRICVNVIFLWLALFLAFFQWVSLWVLSCILHADVYPDWPSIGFSLFLGTLHFYLVLIGPQFSNAPLALIFIFQFTHNIFHSLVGQTILAAVLSRTVSGLHPNRWCLFTILGAYSPFIHQMATLWPNLAHFRAYFYLFHLNITLHISLWLIFGLWPWILYVYEWVYDEWVYEVDEWGVDEWVHSLLLVHSLRSFTRKRTNSWVVDEQLAANKPIIHGSGRYEPEIGHKVAIWRWIEAWASIMQGYAWYTASASLSKGVIWINSVNI